MDHVPFRERVLEVIADRGKGSSPRYESGSGLIVGGRTVLTAAHVVAGAKSVTVRGPDKREHPAELLSEFVGDEETVDLALLELAGDQPRLPPMPLAAVDRDAETAEVVGGCSAVGYPWYKKGHTGERETVHVRGVMPVCSNLVSGLITLNLVDDPPRPLPPQEKTLSRSEWAGMSGAPVLAGDRLIGVVSAHAPREGPGSITVTPLKALDVDDRWNTYGLSNAAEWWARLGVPDSSALLLVPEKESLVELVDVPIKDGLPLVTDLSPYWWATPTEYGDGDSYGQSDPYVARTHKDVDFRVRAALRPGKLVLIVGPSKAGKTRTAFEAVLDKWPDARLLSPTPRGLAACVRHRGISRSSYRLVVWLDDLERFLVGPTEPLTLAMLGRLLGRPGQTVAVATLRETERSRLQGRLGDEESREGSREGSREESREESREGGRADARGAEILLAHVRNATIELGYTKDDPEEQAAARAAYPGLDLSSVGLAEQLAGAARIRDLYQGAEPLVRAVLQSAIDWVRVGMPRPIPEADLSAMTVQRLDAELPYLQPSDEQVIGAVKEASTPLKDGGRVAALGTSVQSDGSRVFVPFDYLVAVDDGQFGEFRDIPGRFWDDVLARAEPEDAFAISVVGAYRSPEAAIRAARQAAKTGHVQAAAHLGYLLSRLETFYSDGEYREWPRDLKEACFWLDTAADAEVTGAMVQLANLYWHEDELRDVAAARRWLKRAAAKGDALAMVDLGIMTKEADPTQLVTARRWLEKAAEAAENAADDVEAVRAMRVLADVYWHDGELRDLAGARSWLERAAAKGDVEAMKELAWMAGEARPPRLDDVRNWVEKVLEAAERAGDDYEAVRAMYWLAGLYWHNDEQRYLAGARSWLERAAAKGDLQAMRELVKMAREADPPRPDDVRRWLEKAADAGDAGAMVELAREFGSGPS